MPPSTSQVSLPSQTGATEFIMMLRDARVGREAVEHADAEIEAVEQHVEEHAMPRISVQIGTKSSTWSSAPLLRDAHRRGPARRGARPRPGRGPRPPRRALAHEPRIRSERRPEHQEIDDDVAEQARSARRRRSATATPSRPCASGRRRSTAGARPRSSIQPAITAMKPSGIASWQTREERAASRRAGRASAAIRPQRRGRASARRMPTMMRKAKNGIATGGRSSGGKSFSPFTSPSTIVREDQAAEQRDRRSRSGWSRPSRRAWRRASSGTPRPRFPARLDRGELRGLVLAAC